MALAYKCRASVMWRLGIALYAKAGGVPWKLADAPPDTAYIGLSYAIRTQARPGERFVSCCSQVFDSDGAGLEFLLYETGDAFIERENPFLKRPEMRRVMSRSLALYQRRHAGRVPRHVVVHKTTEFKPEEIDGSFDALSAVEEIELVQVKQDVPWHAVKLDRPGMWGKKGVPAAYPVERGSYLSLGNREVLLWTQGNAPGAIGGRNYYKEGKGIPAPLELVRFAGHGGWEETCRAVLGLTKMDWNNDSLYDRLPVTLGYAQTLARVVRRMTQLGSRPYAFRFFM
jgi:argonaute-like protein implicated in RNA metabolism and viral defense